MLIIENIYCINIKTKDIEKSLNFYTLFLDFEKIDIQENFCILEFNNIKINLMKVAPDALIDTTFPILSLIMDVDDFTDAIQEVEEEGKTIIAGPSENSNEKGEYIHLQDPSGNVIELFYNE